MKTKRLLLNDIILCLSIIVACLCIYVFVFFRTKDAPCEYAEIFLDGIFVEALSLEKDTVYSIDECDFSIEIKNGNIRVIHTDCDDRTCESMNAGKNGGQIVCLPNKIVIRAQSTRNDSYLVAG